MTLNEKIVELLKNSSSQAPVMLEILRKSTSSLVDDPQLLYNALEMLYANKTVNRISGIKESKPYIAYWLTGMGQTPAPASGITPPRTHIVRRSETDKPATPISTAKAPDRIVKRAQPKPATPAADPGTPIHQHRKPAAQNRTAQTTTEVTMPQKPVKPSAIIVEAVKNKPGITRAGLIELLLKRVPNYTSKSAKAMVMWCQGVGKKIRSEGLAESAKYYPLESGKDAVVKKTAKAKPATAAKTKPVAAPAPKPAMPATINPERINLLFSESGQILVREGANIIALDKADSARLYRFIERVAHG
jgi:hypothetical protein